MVIGAGGAIASVRVTSGAGYEVLDAQALDMIRKLAPEAPLPASLRGREFAVVDTGGLMAAGAAEVTGPAVPTRP